MDTCVTSSAMATAMNDKLSDDFHQQKFAQKKISPSADEGKLVVELKTGNNGDTVCLENGHTLVIENHSGKIGNETKLNDSAAHGMVFSPMENHIVIADDSHGYAPNGLSGYYMDSSMSPAPQLYHMSGPGYSPINVEQGDYEKAYFPPSQPVGSCYLAAGETPSPQFHPHAATMVGMDPNYSPAAAHRYYPGNPSMHPAYAPSPNMVFHAPGPGMNNTAYQGGGASVISVIPNSRTAFSTGMPPGHTYHNLNIDTSPDNGDAHLESTMNSKSTDSEKKPESGSSTSAGAPENASSASNTDNNGEASNSKTNNNNPGHSENGSDPAATGNEGGANGPDANGGEYYVMVHVNGGETFSVKVAGQLQNIQGPATVRMVSKKGPPMLMPMQVPPGHLVQQIVDENGILTHIILSPYPPPPIHGGPLPPMMLSTPGVPPTHPPPHMMACGPPLGADMTGAHLFSPSMQTADGDERSEFSHSNASMGRPRASPMQGGSGNVRTSKRSNANNGTVHEEANNAGGHSRRRKPLRNGSGGGANSSAGGYVRESARGSSAHYPPLDEAVAGGKSSSPPTTTTTTTTATTPAPSTQEVDETTTNHNSNSSLANTKNVLRRILNATPSPQVSEIEARSASIQLYAPEVPEDSGVELKVTEITYDLCLSENGPEGYYKCVFRGEAMEICLRDLKPDTEYFLKVSTCYNNVQGARTAPIRFKTQPCEPNAPKPPVLAQRTRSTLALKWTNATENGSKLTNFLLEWRMAKGDVQQTEWSELYSGLQRYFKVSKLASATEYMFRLAAVNSYGQGPWSEVVHLTTSGPAPEKPDPPQLMRQEVHGLGLSWHKRPSDEKFSMEMEDEATCHGFIPVFLGDQLSHYFDNLRRNTRYRFRLASENSEGRSQWSDVVNYSTLPDAPAPPKKVEVKGKVMSTKFHLCWTESDDDGGATVDEYRVQVCPCAAASPLARRVDTSVGADPELTWQQVYQGHQRDCHITQMTPGCVVWVRVSAHSPGGWGPWSPVPLRVRLSPVAPSVVTGLRLVSTRGQTATQPVHLIWNRPEKDGGAEQLIYEVQELEQATPPQSPTKKKADEDSIRKSSSEETEVFSGNSVERIMYEGNVAECRLTNVKSAQQEHHFRVRAKNELGMAGPWSDPPLAVFTGPGQPMAPRPPTAIWCTAPRFCIQVSWEPPSKCYGAPVTEYRLEMRKCGTENSAETIGKYSHVYTGKERRFELRQHIEPVTGYVFRVQAINAAGAGSFSADSEKCVTGASAPGLVPQVVVTAEPDEEERRKASHVLEKLDVEVRQALNEWSSRADTLWVGWQEAAAHGSPITGYSLEWGLEVAPQATDTNSVAPIGVTPARSTETVVVNPTRCFHVFTGLRPSSQYKIRVQAQNQLGSGPFSSYIRAVTKSLPPTAPQLECVQNHSNALKLKWSPCVAATPTPTTTPATPGSGASGAANSAAANGDVMPTYQLEMSRSATSGWHIVYSGTLLSHKVIKLAEFTTYYFRIRASNKSGVGEWSPVCRFATIKAIPPALKAPKVSDVSMEAATVEWSPIKRMGDDVILYTLQLLDASNNEIEFRQVYRGSETRFHLQGLLPGTEYLVRVAAIRLSSSAQRRQQAKSQRRHVVASEEDEHETNTESDDIEYNDSQNEEEDEEEEEMLKAGSEKEVLCELLGPFSQVTSFQTRGGSGVQTLASSTATPAASSVGASRRKTTTTSVAASGKSAAPPTSAPSTSTNPRQSVSAFLAAIMRRPRFSDQEVALLLLASFVLLVVMAVYLVQNYAL